MRGIERRQATGADDERDGIDEVKLRHAADGYARQMTMTTGHELHRQFDASARPSLDEHSRQRAWRRARPTIARLKTWTLAIRSASEVDLIRSGAGQRHVRTRFVIPLSIQGQLPLERASQ